MRLRWRSIGLLLTAAILIALAAIWYARIPIAERLAAFVISQQELPPVSFTIEELELDRVSLSDVDVPGLGAIASVSVTYGLADRVVRAVRVKGASLRLSYVNGEFGAGPITPYLKGSGNSSAGPSPALPAVTIQDLSLTLETDHGTAKVHLPGSVALDPQSVARIDSALSFSHPMAHGEGQIETIASLDGSAQITARFQTLTVRVPGAAPLDMRDLGVEALVQRDFAEISLGGSVPGLGVVADAVIVAAAPYDRPLVDGRFSLAFEDLARLRAVAPELTELSGQAKVSGTFSGTADVKRSGDLIAFTDSIEGGAVLALEGTGLMLAPYGAAQHVRLNLRADAEPSRLSLTVEEMDLQAVSLAPGLIPPVLRPGGAVPIVDQTIRLTTEPGTTIDLWKPDGRPWLSPETGVAATGAIELEGVVPLRLGFSPLLNAAGQKLPNAAALEFQTEGLQAGPALFDELRISGDVQAAALRAGTVSLYFEAAAKPMTVAGHRLGAVRTRGDLAIVDAFQGGQVRLSLPELRLGASRLSDGAVLDAMRLSVQAEAQLTSCEPSPCQPGLADVEGTVASPALSFAKEGQSLTAGKSRFEVRTRGAGLRRLNILGIVKDLRAAGLGQADRVTSKGWLDWPSLRFEQAAQVTGLSADPALARGLPAADVTLELSGSADAPRYEATVTARGTDVAPIQIAGDLRAASFVLPETGLLALSELAAPFLEAVPDLRDLQGSVSVNGSHRLAENATALQLTIQDAGAGFDDVTATGINGALALRSVNPPLSDGPQKLVIERLEAGLPLTKIAMTYEIGERAGEPELGIQALSLRLLGGRATFDPFRVTASQRSGDLTLNLHSLDLREISQTAAVEGVNGEGFISGRLPVSVRDGEKVAVTGGEITSDGPGILKLPTPLVRDILGEQAGAELERVLGALANFHYSRLSLRVDKGFDGEARITGRIEGHNPDHENGRPFVLNVNLEGNADRLLQTILSVYTTATGALEGGVRRLQ